jgi:hypothetical protein
MKHIITLLLLISMSGYSSAQTDKSRKQTITEDIQVSTVPFKFDTLIIATNTPVDIVNSGAIIDDFLIAREMPVEDNFLDRFFLGTEIRAAGPISSGRLRKCF